MRNTIWGKDNGVQNRAKGPARRKRVRMSVHNRFWIFACLATCLFFFGVEGKSLRRVSRERAPISNKKLADLQHMRSHRRLQQEEEPEIESEEATLDGGEDDDEQEGYLYQGETNAADVGDDEDEDYGIHYETSTTALDDDGDEDEEYSFQKEMDVADDDEEDDADEESIIATGSTEEEDPSLRGGVTTTAAGIGSSPFFFGTGDTGDENPSPFLYFGPQQSDEDGETQTEAESIPSTGLNVTGKTNEDAGTNPVTEQPKNDTMASPAQFESEQSPQPEYTNFHFGAGQVNQQEYSSNNQKREEHHQGLYVDGDLVDQFANMFNMVHGGSGHYPSPDPGSSSSGKGSIYYSEFEVHGKGGKGSGKGKGGKGKGKGSSGKGGGMPHDSDQQKGSTEPSNGTGSSGKRKMSKKSSLSEPKVRQKEHRLTMPPKETNHNRGGSSDRSRRV